MTQQLAKKESEKLFHTTLADKGLHLARKQLGKEVAEKMGQKELIPWTLAATVSEMQSVMRSAMSTASTAVITRAVQVIFSYSGVDRDTFKRLTGLEARVFMRGDARIYIHFDNLASAIVGSRTAAFFERTAQDLALERMFKCESGKMMLQEALDAVILTTKQVLAWQQNVSAWWLLNATYSTLRVDTHIGREDRHE